MEVRILDSSMVVDFLNVGFDAAEICLTIESETEKIAQSIKAEKLKDWEVYFRFSYTNVKQILIYTKSKSYPKEKYKEITTHIPIPTKDKAPWGVNSEQHVYDNENYLDHLIKNFHCLDVDYSKFSGRKEYILDCMRRGIDYCFKIGFTVNGIKVKIK